MAVLLLAIGALGAWLTRPSPTPPGPTLRGLTWILEDQDLLSSEPTSDSAPGSGSDTAAGSGPGPAAAPRVDVEVVRDLLAAIPAATTPIDGYDREAFGKPWADMDRNGCDTRNDILRRDLDAPTMKSGSWCTVAAGVLDDPYTGTTIDFQRGEQTSPLVQIDHIVPLAWAWRNGAADWDTVTKLKFANDPVELVAVDGEANNAKADSGPAGWLPPDTESQCAYVAVFTLVVAQYQLTIDDADRAAISTTLDTCP
ncbi:HNH endonuclease family protein [Cnuibacter sp. UC19_7]|uniref:HNH endonuclease family protein n=1 Tax=Cnuibacter sp. UC19_7 TaxID=3350166 RepID=UPI00366E0A71